MQQDHSDESPYYYLFERRSNGDGSIPASLHELLVLLQRGSGATGEIRVFRYVRAAAVGHGREYDL